MLHNQSNFVQLIGVDVGGSHIASALLELNQIVSGSYYETKLDSKADANTILEAWLDNISKTISASSCAEPGIAIAMPGPFDYSNGVSLIQGMQKYDALYGLNIKTVFAENLGIPTDKIHFFNDAQSFILGEATSGVAKDYTNVIGITLGTGVGSAVCRDLNAIDVNRGSAYFLDGIVEEYLSTRWFVKRYFELSGKVISDVKALCELDDAEGFKVKIFKEFSINLAAFLIEFIADEKPEIVVLGGGIAKASAGFLPLVAQKIKEIYPYVKIERTKLWDSSALIGATAAVTNSQHKHLL